MKFIASLALTTALAHAVNIEGQTALETEVSAAVETQAVTGPIVPEDFGVAVHDFDVRKPFTDQECYQKQVDIYSDQIIAIEAIRLEVIKLDYAVTQAENDFANNLRTINTSTLKMEQNEKLSLDNRTEIELLQLDVNDVGDCLERQIYE